jgi:multiple sugar transport system substrate-binding protein
MKRIIFCLTLLFATMLLLAACGNGAVEDKPTETTTPTESPDPEQLTLIIHPTPFERLGGAGPDGLVAQFVAETGINVDVVTAEADDQIARMELEFAQESDTLDVILVLGPWTADSFMENFMALDPFIEASDTIAWDDVLPALRANSNFNDGIRYVPASLGLEYFYYFKDALAETGLDVPTTPGELDEFVRAATTDDRHGIVLRGSGSQLVQDFWTVAGLYGATELTEDGACNYNSEEAVSAVELIKGWLDDEILPKDFLAWGRDELVGAMQQGTTASVLSFHLRYPSYIRDGSTEAADLGWARPPGEITRDPTAGGGLGISAYSDAPDAAWRLIEFLMSPENSDFAIDNWGHSVYRTSQATPERIEALAPLADWLADASATVPVLIHENSSQMNDILSSWLNRGIGGELTPQEAMDNACDEVEPLL